MGDTILTLEPNKVFHYHLYKFIYEIVHIQTVTATEEKIFSSSAEFLSCVVFLKFDNVTGLSRLIMSL